MRRTVGIRHVTVIVTLLMASCGGGGGADGGANEAAHYEIRGGDCDPLRGTGTITNRAGESAAFRVKVLYDYPSGEQRPPRTAETPVLADGESFDFSAGPDPSGSAPRACRIIGADRIEAAPDDIAEAEERQDAEADAPELGDTIEPVWMMAGINGSVDSVAMRDGVGFLASNLAQGTGIAGFDAESGSIIWELESDLRIEHLEAAADGGVLAISGNQLVAFDADGQQIWETEPLNRPGGSLSSTISRIVATNDQIVVGGSAPGSLAGIDPGSGEQLWYLHQDEALDEDPMGFGGGDAHLSVSDHGVLVSGGPPALRHLSLVAVDGDEPAVLWAVEGAGSNVATDGETVVDAVGDRVVAFDLATGDQLWEETDGAWEQSPAAQPAITGDTVIVQRANSTIAFDLFDGERRWEKTDLSVVLSGLGAEMRIGDHVFGVLSGVQYVLIGADGTIVDLEFLADEAGSPAAGAAEDGRVLLASRGSSNREPSAVWLIDLGDHG